MIQSSAVYFGKYIAIFGGRSDCN